MRRPNQRLALLWRGSGAICPVVLGHTRQLQSRSPLRELPRRTTGRRARPSSIGAAACKQVRSPSMGPRPRANGQRWADQGPYSCCAMPKYMPRSIIGSAASSLHDQPAFTVRPTARRLGRIGGEPVHVALVRAVVGIPLRFLDGIDEPRNEGLGRAPSERSPEPHGPIRQARRVRRTAVVGTVRAAWRRRSPSHIEASALRAAGGVAPSSSQKEQFVSQTWPAFKYSRCPLFKAHHGSKEFSIFFRA